MAARRKCSLPLPSSKSSECVHALLFPFIWSSPMTDANEHEAEMKALQKQMRGKMAAARRRKGLIIVHTGDGKGKTSAALGMLLRSLGHGFKCAVVQFIKGGRGTAESLLRSPRLRWDKVGQGFTGKSKGGGRDRQWAGAGWSWCGDTWRTPS